MPIDPNNLAATAVLTFKDEFDSLSLWNGKTGTWATIFPTSQPLGNGSTLSNNGELQWYINARYPGTDKIKPWAVKDGVLSLKAERAPAGMAKHIERHKYVSGYIDSYPSFSQTYGYFEIKAQMPPGKGLWPAFWLLPTNKTWPPEIDILEIIGKDITNLHTTVHYNEGGKHLEQGKGTTIPDPSAGFHTYGVNWQKDFITWYFDGKQVFQVATPAELHQPMYMIANLAVGGYWGGSPNGSTRFPASYKIDYIRAYAEAPAVKADVGARAPAVAQVGVAEVPPAALTQPF